MSFSAFIKAHSGELRLTHLTHLADSWLRLTHAADSWSRSEILETFLFFKMGQPEPLLCGFSFFSNTKFTEKMQASAGFELGLSE